MQTVGKKEFDVLIPSEHWVAIYDACVLAKNVAKSIHDDVAYSRYSGIIEGIVCKYYEKM